jgi:hypothetical protein
MISFTPFGNLSIPRHQSHFVIEQSALQIPHFELHTYLPKIGFPDHAGAGNTGVKNTSTYAQGHTHPAAQGSIEVTLEADAQW